MVEVRYAARSEQTSWSCYRFLRLRRYKLTASLCAISYLAFVYGITGSKEGTVGGAVVGGVVGNKIGKNNARRKCVDQAAYRSETHYRKLPNGRYEKVVYRYVHE
ncbi:glycine zipper 2TM domain-containing protein [Asticcacaulis sp. AC402]|uniref:glycine zipper 2TM domain-containing protein n=1 Tax=Asticcacaulis sp. AC402 TaxID=1282361 RepID=UPI0003C41113|nr:glycine zipper 2TM domain-containing protein [Asticcacaulis sp. AC402]ESQ75784.1 hypothetical protein ABAC402_07400 [Asticcacaulis sp. AC402]